MLNPLLVTAVFTQHTSKIKGSGAATCVNGALGSEGYQH